MDVKILSLTKPTRMLPSVISPSVAMLGSLRMLSGWLSRNPQEVNRGCGTGSLGHAGFVGVLGIRLAKVDVAGLGMTFVVGVPGIKF